MRIIVTEILESWRPLHVKVYSSLRYFLTATSLFVGDILVRRCRVSSLCTSGVVSDVTPAAKYHVAAIICDDDSRIYADRMS